MIEKEFIFLEVKLNGSKERDECRDERIDCNSLYMQNKLSDSYSFLPPLQKKKEKNR